MDAAGTGTSRPCVRYGWERLRESGEADAVRARHFGFFLELARRAAPELTKAEQLHWLDRLQSDHDNLRAALEWRLASDGPGHEGLELAAHLCWFWLKRAYLAEGQHWLERALARSAAPPPARGRRHSWRSAASSSFRETSSARTRLLEESAALARDAGELSTVASPSGCCTMAAIERGDVAGAAAAGR